MPLNLVIIENETHPETSVLKNVAQEVHFPLSAQDKQLIAQMNEMVYQFDGVGLAAPQVGVAKKIAVIYIPESAALLRDNALTQPLHVIINPEYWPIDPNDKQQDFEACYSVSSVMGKVPRFHAIKVKYQDEAGNVIVKNVEGFYARVLQHEIDHLNGLLITDRLTPDSVQGDFAAMLKLRRAELPEEKRQQLDALLKQKGLMPEEE